MRDIAHRNLSLKETIHFKKQMPVRKLHTNGNDATTMLSNGDLVQSHQLLVKTRYSI